MGSWCVNVFFFCDIKKGRTERMMYFWVNEIIFNLENHSHINNGKKIHLAYHQGRKVSMHLDTNHIITCCLWGDGGAIH